MKQEYEPLSLFDVEAASGASSRDAGLLPVARMAFLGSETASWETLFDGFDTLHAVTYSTGTEFLCALVKRFERAEVVFGYEGVLSFAVHEVLAYQLKTIERLRESLGRHQDALLARLDEGSLRFMVARERLSHEKVYLLSAKDGRRRVITGSANLSRAAFSGRQRENICCLDDEAAYEWYKEGYDALCESSSDEISVRALAVADDAGHADEIPIAGTVMVKKALVVEAEAEATEAVRFALDVKNLSGKLAPYMPKADRKGKWLLAPETVRRTRRLLSEAATQEKELRSEYPALEIDAANGAASLNGGPLDLNPAPEAVAADVALFLEYMDGYARFHGGVEEMQQRYYAFANWFFASPLLAVMRDMAVRYNQNLLPYPVFGLVYGQSKAGKTSFLETLLKMMIGQKTKLAAPDFTRSSIEQLKRKVKGAPIIVDDLTQTRFSQHAVETIKNDDFGVAEGLIHYPAVVISANEDVKAVAPEIVRRAVICRAQAGLKNTELMRNNVVRRVQGGIGTALYRAYLGKMLRRMPPFWTNCGLKGARARRIYWRRPPKPLWSCSAHTAPGTRIM